MGDKLKAKLNDDDFAIPLNTISSTEEDPQEHTVLDSRADKILSGNDTFVSHPEFLRIRYGIVSILEMTKSPAVKIIVSTFIKSIAIEAKLAQEGRICEDISDEAKELIKSYSTYAEYTGQRNVVSISLEKAIQVAAAIYTNFTYQKRIMASVFTFTSFSQDYSLSLVELLKMLEEEYKRVNKTLVITEFKDGYKEDIANILIKKKYDQAEVPVPTHLVALRTYINEKMPVTRSIYLSDENLELIGSTLMNSETNFPEITVRSGEFRAAKKKFGARSLHEIEEVLNLNNTREEEILALETQILKGAADQSIKDQLGAILRQTAIRPENKHIPDIENVKVGELNLGWFSVSMTDPKEQAKVDYKRKLEAKFSSREHIFIFLGSLGYLFIESKRGKKYRNVAVLQQFLVVLPKLVHILALLIQVHSGSAGVMYEAAKKITISMAKTISRDKGTIDIISAQLMMTVYTWMRPINITKFGVPKSKYMPSRVVMEPVDPDSEEEQEGDARKMLELDVRDIV